MRQDPRRDQDDSASAFWAHQHSLPIAARSKLWWIESFGSTAVLFVLGVAITASVFASYQPAGIALIVLLVIWTMHAGRQIGLPPQPMPDDLAEVWAAEQHEG